MSNINEISNELEELRRLGEMIINISERLSEILGSFDEKVAEDTTVDETKAYTLEDVRLVLAKKSQSGYTADIKALLMKYGADKLSAIDPSKYTALLEDVEAIGDE